jgi:hypothetical protein
MSPETVTPNQLILVALIFRGSILLLISAVGGLSLFLGWKLYMENVTGRSSAAASGAGMHFRMSSVAPGAFFALFGAFILIYMILQPLDVRQALREQQPPAPSHVPETPSGMSDQRISSPNIIPVQLSKPPAPPPKTNCPPAKEESFSIRFADPDGGRKIGPTEVHDALKTVLVRRGQILTLASNGSLEEQKNLGLALATLTSLEKALERQKKTEGL